MSVFKLPIAVAALKKMETENIPLDSMAYMEPEQIHKNTYSPLRDKHPQGRIRISYREAIEYTVAHSDNNTCDWLIEFAGGINNIDAYMKSLGIEDLNLTETEHDMHVNIMNCYNNWSTPLSIARLLKKIYTENVLTEEHFAFLEKTMLDCSSGKDKLKAGLPAGIPLAHKTGHSDRMPDGLQISDADAGVIYLPDGEKCFLVVLIKDSRETDRDNAGIMAGHSRYNLPESAKTPPAKADVKSAISLPRIFVRTPPDTFRRRIRTVWSLAPPIPKSDPIFRRLPPSLFFRATSKERHSTARHPHIGEKPPHESVVVIPQRIRKIPSSPTVARSRWKFGKYGFRRIGFPGTDRVLSDMDRSFSPNYILFCIFDVV